MINKKDLNEFVGNEKLFIKKVFSFNEDIRRKLYNITFSGECNQAVLTAITKYLLHVEKVSPYKVEYLLQRYLIVFLYSYLNSKGYVDSVSSFDKMLEKDISLKTLEFTDFKDDELDDDLVKLYLKIDEREEAKKHESKSKKNIVERYRRLVSNANSDAKVKSKDPSSVSTLDKLLKKEGYYFSESRDLFPNVVETNARKYDEIIAIELHDNQFFDFKIKIPEDSIEAFNKNFAETRSKEYFGNMRKLILGYILNEAIINENYDFEQPIKLLQAVQVKVLLCMKNANVSYKLPEAGYHSIIEFVEHSAEGFDYVAKEKIIPFKFILNDVEYMLSSKGIKKI